MIRWWDSAIIAGRRHKFSNNTSRIQNSWFSPQQDIIIYRHTPVNTCYQEGRIMWSLYIYWFRWFDIYAIAKFRFHTHAYNIWVAEIYNRIYQDAWSTGRNFVNKGIYENDGFIYLLSPPAIMAYLSFQYFHQTLFHRIWFSLAESIVNSPVRMAIQCYWYEIISRQNITNTSLRLMYPTIIGNWLRPWYRVKMRFNGNMSTQRKRLHLFLGHVMPRTQIFGIMPSIIGHRFK